MMLFYFSTLELILLVWSLVFVITLICMYFSDRYRLPVSDILILYLFLPFVLIIWGVRAIYRATVGAIIKLTKDKNYFMDKYHEVTKQLEEKTNEIFRLKQKRDLAVAENRETPCVYPDEKPSVENETKAVTK